MKILCRARILWILFLLYNKLCTAGPVVFPVGETLSYKVSWSVFRLGTLKITVVDTLRMDDRRVYHARLNIDSNPLLFFINRHSEFNTYFDDDLCTHLFRSQDAVDGINYNTEYHFDYRDSVLSIDMTDMNDPDKRIQRKKPFHDRVLDGTSLLYYARLHAGETRADTTFFLFAGGFVPTYFEFRGEGKPIKIHGVEKKLKTGFVEGLIPGEGIAGLSGRFKGWFTVQNQKIPLKAQLKVFIGHVNLELESWKNCMLGTGP